MKKYLLGFFAFTLAFALSAFTSHNKHAQRPQTPMLWYEVNTTTGNLVNYQAPFNAVPETHDYFLNNEGLCDGGNHVDCARGYDSTIHKPLSATDRNEDDIIRKN